MAAGVLVISAAYAAGRDGSASTAWSAVYWLGEAILFAPLVWLVLRRSGPGEAQAAGLVLCAATATYLVKFCYSPAAFTFPDELEHWRTTVNLLSSHHLFGVNYVLPVSAVYPGLEEVTGAVVSVTGLPLFTAGLIVAGLAHLLFMAALFIVFRLVSRSPRVALAACLIYATNPHYQVFDAIYGYQTLALAFFGLALVAALGISRRARSGGADRIRWWILAVTLAAATVVTHHVTSYLLAASLLLLAAVGAARRWAAPGTTGPGRGTSGRGAIAAAILAGVCVSFIVIWIGLAAPSTVGYLTPPLHSFADGLAGVFTAHAASSGATPAGPLSDRLVSYAATLLIMAGLPFGWWQIWRSQRRNTWALALGTGAAAYYLLALLRVTTPDGAELAGRGLTFVYIPVSYTLAMALAGPGVALLRRIDRLVRARRVAPAALVGRVGRIGRVLARRAVPIALGALAAGTLLVGGIASGWPPYWERLPGRYAVDGFESGITPEGIAAAKWARTALPPGQRIAADYTNYLLLGSYGDQDPVGNLDALYCGPAWTSDDAALASQQAIGYLLVDVRMSEQTAVTGGYFTDSSEVCPAPIPRPDLTKFDSVPGFNRIYDSGNIVIYALPGTQNAP
jgi:hypothetical protein